MDAVERARRDRDAIFGMGPAVGQNELPTVAMSEQNNGVETGRRRRMFTPFLVKDQVRAATLAEHLAAQAAIHPGLDGDAQLATVMSTARALADAGDKEMVQHALGLFLTHHPLGHKLTVPSLLKRTAFAVQSAVPLPDETLGSRADGDEAKLDWFREDPLLNEHHEHWHWVYPNRAGEGDPIYKVKERHGELFYYMHEQMLARYDVERVAAGLERVEPIKEYAGPLGAGYDPGRLADYGFSPRETDSVMVPYEDISPETQDGFRKKLVDAVAGKALVTTTGTVALEGHSGSNILGLTSETTDASVDGAYGNHHGNGHVLIGDLDARPGVILSPSTAIRDPAFWRWHRHVDDLHFSYQDNLSSHDFGDRPPVDIKKLALGFERDHPGSEREGADLSDAANATITTGGTDTLETTMRLGAYELLTGNRYRFDYLSHSPFFIATELQNRDAAIKAITLRFFLIPDQLFDVNGDPTTATGRQMRRFAIELDKVRFRAQPGAQAFGRSGRQMAVVRRPVVVDPGEVVDVDGSTTGSDARTCTCGWPYGLLLPRGSAEGMSFTLFAMATDNELDRVGSQKKCGSMSFCGVGDEYPDARPMGYPFDRPFEKPLADIVHENSNMMLLPLKIRWTNPPPLVGW
ncbi:MULTISPECIES: tyrosinase family protein [Rhizobium]|nr:MULTISPECIES: tyrosinase family protein [Rhizobium]NKL19299.1 hypothetical protein [Rhizobium leguminosarum bv. viciae]NKL38231.1 hypothetical protein [Rhizobium leguminosarum bv. viciae]NKL57727.1 hypothetical protein [Rhizobium leguminosarum bv. viciae]QKK34629.1 tyrosinase family protein [Rhizobium indicum]